MRKLPLFSALVLFAFLGACNHNSNTEQTNSKTDAVTQQTVNRDSIHQRYTQLFEARESPFPVQQVIEKGKVNPVDQSPLDTSFFLFWEDLKEAVAQKDIFFMLDHIDEHIKNGFGDNNGAENFVTTWNLNDEAKAQRSEIWPILKRITSYGGVFENGRKNFYAPYFTSAVPAEVDPYVDGMILGQGVRLRSGPSVDFRIAGVVSFEVVKILDDNAPEATIKGETYPWVKIQLANGTEGFVFGKFVGRPIDFRAGFEKQGDGVWRMVFLLAGD